MTKVWLDITHYQPLSGGSYFPLPTAVKDKKAIINVKNKDDKCLGWSLRAALFPPKDQVDRTSNYPTKDGLNFKGVNTPTPLNQLDLAGRQNHLAIYWLSRQEVDCRVNLFLVTKDEPHHYTWIKDLNRLLNKQSKDTHRLYFCERCLHGFTREDLLEEHKHDCRGINQAAVAIEMPEPSTYKAKIRFEDHHKQLKTPYVIYADFKR